MVVDEGNNNPWRLTCWYGEAQKRERQKTWDMMTHIRADSDLPWLCIGDFNEVLRREEHMSICDRDENQMRGFREAVDICGLCDIGYIGLDWTFEKKVAGGHYCRIRLDRALASPSWCSRFPFANLRHLTAACSDHSPILLSLDRDQGELARDRSSKTFKYEIMWETHSELRPLVEQVWSSGGDCKSLSDVQQKLSDLSCALQGWNKSTFGSVRTETRSLKIRLESLRQLPGRVGPSHEEIKIQDRLVELNYREEIMWRQRSRIQWLSEGDQNTKFFHQKASGRKKRNRISRITRSDGSVTEDLDEMKNMTVDFYKQLYTAEGTMGVNEVLSHVPVKVSAEMNEGLTREVSAEEVKSALFQMQPSKAPGSDGYPAHFFQKHWGVCGKDLTMAVIRILAGQDDLEKLNETLLVLIPKVPSPSLLTQYRPISLCNVLFKIASKVLANRLKNILPSIVSPEQSAFVPGRLITDNIITAYECLHFMKKKKVRNRCFGALKLDMMKAYDRVEWDYLEAIMLKFGFSSQWVDMVMRGVRSVSFSVLFNGGKTEFFNPSRGIRQGDPLSPYLFLIAAEGLSCLLQHRETTGRLKGLVVADSAPSINHLLFADDSLMFFKANQETAMELETTLNQYCLASGQRINRDKSSIFFSKGCPELVKNEVKAILQVSNESLNEKYLGLPSDVGKSKNGAFKYLKDRIWKKIQGWLELILSSGGKEVLIKSVAQAVLVYAMSCFKLPRGLCEHINTMIRKFWWGSKEGKRKPAWVSWDVMIQPKYMGGLGFRDLELFNLAMLARQAWRIIQDPSSLSARVLKALYFPNTDFLDAQLGNSPSQIWRAIHEGLGVLKQGLIRRIGNGKSTHMWEHNWIPREEHMRPITSRGDDEKVLVSDLIDSTSACWKEDMLNATFLPMDVHAIMEIPLSLINQEDTWAWSQEKNGVFRVRSAYRMLIHTKKIREDWLDHRPATSNASDEGKKWCSLWRTKIPSKIRVFAWRLAHNSVPSADVLQARNMAVSRGCQICLATEDSWRHSLVDCNMARCVWALVDENITEHMSMNQNPNAKQWLFAMLESLDHKDFITMLVTLWSIWTARRKAVHEGEFQSPMSTFEFVKRFLADLGEAYQTKPKKGTVQRRPGVSRWVHPPSGLVKINVDAAVSREADHGAVGAVCRDSSGLFIGASARTIKGISDPATLESIACAEAISLAEDLGITKMMVSSDCLEVINMMKEKSLCSYRAILHELEIKSNMFEEISFIHEGRDTNVDAHLLARNSIAQPFGRRVWFTEPPDFVTLIIPHE
jgi:hypothetical protein